VCHCDSQYVGRTSQRLEERTKQHIPKSITNPPTPHIRQTLPRPGKDTSPRQFHESDIGQHLLDNAQCALHYNKDKSSVLAWARTSFHLSALEATFIKSLNPLLCKSSRLQWKKNLSFGFQGFCGWCIGGINLGLLANVIGPWAPTAEKKFSLKCLVENWLKSKSFEPLTNVIGFWFKS